MAPRAAATRRMLDTPHETPLCTDQSPFRRMSSAAMVFYNRGSRPDLSEDCQQDEDLPAVPLPASGHLFVRGRASLGLKRRCNKKGRHRSGDGLSIWGVAVG